MLAREIVARKWEVGGNDIRRRQLDG